MVCAVYMIHAHQEESFLQANQLYAQGEYQAAFDAYNALENKGYGVYYNMGNALYKRGAYAQALVYWKKAQRLATGVQVHAVMHNIHQAEKKLAINTQSFARNAAFVTGPYVSYLPALLLQITWLLFVCLLLLSYVRHSGHVFVLHMLMCMTGLAMSGGAIAVKQSLQLQDHAIIISKQGALFSGPNQKYHQLAMMDKGSEVVVSKQHDNWCKVSSGPMTGWVRTSDILFV